MNVERQNLHDSDKNIVSVLEKLTEIEMVKAFLSGDYEALDKRFVGKEEDLMKEINYLHSQGPYSNKIMPKIITCYGKPHNMDIIESAIHTPAVVGGSVEDYEHALNSVTAAKLAMGMLEREQPAEELEEELEPEGKSLRRR